MEDHGMSVIVLGTPKGGAGKSTSSVVLGTTLARRGATVTIIDADKNKDLTDWYGDGGKPIKVLPAGTEEDFIKKLDTEAASVDAVIVDLAGAATTILSRSILRADLVLIPMQPSKLDAKHAGRMIGLIQQEMDVLRRPIPFRLFMTRTSDAVPTKATRQLLKQMTAKGMPLLSTHLNQRESFKSLFELNCTLWDLDPKKVNGVPQAIENAERFTDEVVSVMKSIVAGRIAA
jgi:chromosome partitioning protein